MVPFWGAASVIRRCWRPCQGSFSQRHVVNLSKDSMLANKKSMQNNPLKHIILILSSTKSMNEFNGVLRMRMYIAIPAQKKIIRGRQMALMSRSANS